MPALSLEGKTLFVRHLRGMTPRRFGPGGKDVPRPSAKQKVREEESRTSEKTALLFFPAQPPLTVTPAAGSSITQRTDFEHGQTPPTRRRAGMCDTACSSVHSPASSLRSVSR